MWALLTNLFLAICWVPAIVGYQWSSESDVLPERHCSLVLDSNWACCCSGSPGQKIRGICSIYKGLPVFPTLLLPRVGFCPRQGSGYYYWFLLTPLYLLRIKSTKNGSLNSNSKKLIKFLMHYGVYRNRANRAISMHSDLLCMATVKNVPSKNGKIITEISEK